jgi:hypothetical protein
MRKAWDITENNRRSGGKGWGWVGITVETEGIIMWSHPWTNPRLSPPPYIWSLNTIGSFSCRPTLYPPPHPLDKKKEMSHLLEKNQGIMRVKNFHNWKLNPVGLNLHFNLHTLVYKTKIKISYLTFIAWKRFMIKNYNNIKHFKVYYSKQLLCNLCFHIQLTSFYIYSWV